MSLAGLGTLPAACQAAVPARCLCASHPPRCRLFLSLDPLASPTGRPRDCCRLVQLEPALSAPQLAPLLTSCCKLPHAVLALSERELRMVRLGPGEGRRLTLQASEAQLMLVTQTSELVRNALQRSKPNPEDMAAVAAWDRCVRAHRALAA